MSATSNIQSQLEHMDRLVMIIKQVIDDFMNDNGNKLFDKQMSSECSETFFYICLGREDCLPKKHQVNLVPYYSATLNHHIEAARDTLKYILLDSGKPRMPNEQSYYLLELFKKCHSKYHPEVHLVVEKNALDNSKEINSRPNILTIGNSRSHPINPNHLELMELMILNSIISIKENMSNLGSMNEQLLAEFTQTLFYTSLSLERYLPESHQTRVVPYMKAYMTPAINNFKSFCLKISKEISVFPNEFLLPQIITMFKIASRNLNPNIQFLETMDADRIPMH